MAQQQEEAAGGGRQRVSWDCNHARCASLLSLRIGKLLRPGPPLNS